MEHLVNLLFILKGILYIIDMVGAVNHNDWWMLVPTGDWGSMADYTFSIGMMVVTLDIIINVAMKRMANVVQGLLHLVCFLQAAKLL